MLSVERLMKLAEELQLHPRDVFVAIETDRIKEPNDPHSFISELTVQEVALQNVGGRSPVTFVMVKPDDPYPNDLSSLTRSPE